jgi:hypothetical protein
MVIKIVSRDVRGEGLSSLKRLMKKLSQLGRGGSAKLGMEISGILPENGMHAGIGESVEQKTTPYP